MRTRNISVQHLLAGSEARLGLQRVICEKGLANRLRRVQVRRCIYGGAGGSSGHDMIPAVALVQRDGEPHPTFLEDIRATNISCIFVSVSEAISDGLRRFAEQAGIPLVTSTHDGLLLESRLRGLLREKIDRHIRVHGVLLKMFGLGVLIQGDSGAGKTTAGMALVRRGHTWIADDVIQINKRHGRRLHARGCKSTRDLVDLKESGIQKAQNLFTDCRLAQETDLHLVLEMKRKGGDTDRRISESERGVREIMGMQLPIIRLPSFRDADFDLSKLEERVKTFTADGGAS